MSFSVPYIAHHRSTILTATLGQATTLPYAFTARTLHDPALAAWNMDTCASSYLNNSITRLSENFNTYGALSHYKDRLVVNGSTQLDGILVTCDSSRMFLSQRMYATEILERAGMVSYNSSRTPINTESKLGDDGDLVRVLYVPSHYHYADIFTKGLPSILFEEFCTRLSIWCPSYLTAEEC
nr:ribonuclease H-like domain-containing protein [Tanacetum cinerariifolium]